MNILLTENITLFFTVTIPSRRDYYNKIINFSKSACRRLRFLLIIFLQLPRSESAHGSYNMLLAIRSNLRQPCRRVTSPFHNLHGKYAYVPLTTSVWRVVKSLERIIIKRIPPSGGYGSHNSSNEKYLYCSNVNI